jgi:hypothetical protein
MCLSLCTWSFVWSGVVTPKGNARLGPRRGGELRSAPRSQPWRDLTACTVWRGLRSGYPKTDPGRQNKRQPLLSCRPIGPSANQPGDWTSRDGDDVVWSGLDLYLGPDVVSVGPSEHAGNVLLTTTWQGALGPLGAIRSDEANQASSSPSTP